MDVNNAVPPILPRWSTTPLGGRVARTLRVGDALGARVVRGVGPPGVLTRSGTSALPQHRGRSEGIAAEALAHGVDRRGDRLPRRAVGAGVRLLGVTLSNLVEDAPRQMTLDDVAAVDPATAAADGAARRFPGTAGPAATRGPSTPTAW